MKKYIIIGAGILGSSTAYHLAKKGANVTVIDRQDVGQATAAAAGIICPWLSQRRNKAWYALAKAGAAYYDSLIFDLEQDGETETGYRKVGALALHSDEDKLSKMEDRATKRRVDATEIGSIKRLDASETGNLFKPLSNGFSSVHISGAARVNGKAIRDSLTRAAKKHGAQFVFGSAELLGDSNRVSGVQVNGVAYYADRVIIAAGAWAGELLASIGIHFNVRGQKAQIMDLHLNDIETTEWPVVMPPNDQYILAFEGGRIVIGATHEDGLEFDQRVTAGGLHELLDKALHIAPGLKDATVGEVRVGYRPFTPGFLPVIGEVTGVDGLLMANGLGASGLTVGPFLGQQLAKLALGENVDIDLDLYKIEHAIL